MAYVKGQRQIQQWICSFFFFFNFFCNSLYCCELYLQFQQTCNIYKNIKVDLLQIPENQNANQNLSALNGAGSRNHLPW